MQRAHPGTKTGSDREERTMEAAVINDPRAYQIEMLEESKKRNIIVAMDTGSGKTKIAILRAATELERSPSQKRIWFLCPTVALAEQQHHAMSLELPAYQVRLLSGNDGVEHWSNQSIWDGVLRNINIVVCTHQVLLDALTHAFVQMTNIALLIFDEAHHCVKNHAANKIMKHFYHPMRQETPQEVPGVLGLTASPVVGKKPEGLKLIEQNLNAISKTPKIHRKELMAFVHRPEIVELVYEAGAEPPPLLQRFQVVFNELDITQDPYMIRLWAEDYAKYVELLTSRKTYCQIQVKRLLGMATEVNNELGPWASGHYIYMCVRKFQSKKQPAFQILENMNEEEKHYLQQQVFDCLPIPKSDKKAMLCDQDLSRKARMLLTVLVNEMHEGSAGIVFVKTRAAVKLLSVLLSRHPSTKDILKVGTFVGMSNNQARTSSISDLIDINEQKDTLEDLRNGGKNLIIATSVCEEGIDISACNIVICFEKPPNLKSFIQRRGRARRSSSKYIIMLSKADRETVSKWEGSEAEMIMKYMDDKRELGQSLSLEDGEQGHREFVVRSTNAKITLDDALSHLHHFCNRLPSIPYAELAPVFLPEEHEGKQFSCRVILPNSVHSSLREFRTSRLWSTERLACMDAAFEAYIKLYHAGLVNHHMLPSPRHDEETERCLAEVKRRPAMAEIDEELNPWQPIAASWRSSLKLFSFDVRITSGREKIKMKMISPCPLPPVSSFALYVDAETTLQVEIGEAIERGYDQTNITVANEITQMFFSSAFPKRTKENESDFPLLFLPLDILDDLQLWLDSMNGTYQFQDIHSGKVDITKIGLVSDLWGNPYSLHAIEQDRPESSEGEVNTEANPVLKVMKLSKRADFLHRIASDASPASKELRDLDPNNCKFNRLSIPFALFARYIPSIMHRIQNSLILEHLCNGLLAPIVPSNRTDIYSAVSSPMAREDDNYQRLEFLGDAILKLLTSITLMAEHLLWHEGYLSSAKNHIVSNGRLALAAQETGLAKYIITTPFTGKKWRPLYNTELLSPQPVSPREVSTKVLADVVEALLGAAYLDGGFPKSFSFLRILIPEVKWLPLPQQNETLFSSVSSSGPSSSIPPNLAHLQSIIGHDFGNKTILLEAITHPSHISSPPTPSYQRLEFLGDAILDYLVTRTIWSHSASSPLTVPQMHTIRVAAVNGPFLAFCALSHTISIPITSIDHKPVPSIKGKRSKICPTSFSASARFLCLADFLRRAPSNALTSALALTRSRFEILHTTIRSALDKHQAYPWRELEAFAPEKFVSDLIESVLGAVYIDTRGDFDACERVAREFGIIGWVEQTLKKGGKILNPKHELGMMAVKEGVRYEAWAEKEEEEGEPEEHGSDSDSDIADGAGPSGRLDGKGVDKRQEEDMVLGQGKCRCKIFVGEREICEVQGWNRKEVEIAAAEEAVRILSEERKVKAEEKDTNGDEKEMGDEEKETDEEAEQEYFYECEGGEDDSET